MHTYEVRTRKDKRGVDLISDALPFGGLCMAGRTRRKTQSTTRSTAAVHMMPVIRVYDAAGNVIQSHERTKTHE